MKPNLCVNIGKLKLKNPVMVASGTFGYAEEFVDFIDLKKLGAIVTKTITLNPRQGNPVPRTCETPSGMLNSIGLENPGLEIFIKEKIPYLKKIGVPLIVSIASEKNIREFEAIVKELDKIEAVSAIELNISCPNVGVQGSGFRVQGNQRTKNNELRTKLISQDAQATFEVVSKVRSLTQKTLITKLSPNVTDIAEIALSAENAGSDAISLINTITGMSIDVDTGKPKIAQGIAGLSGPAIRPVAVRMVWEVARKVNIPVIGMGGIMDVQSALEFFLAGATAVSVGTANFINPKASIEIISGIKDYLLRKKFNQINQIIGCVKIEK